MFRVLALISAAVLLATVSVHALPVPDPCSDGNQTDCPSTASVPDPFIDTTEIQSAKTAQSSDPNVRLTYYWITYQTPKDQGNVELRSCNGKILHGTASKKFAQTIRMEGSGHLLNGKMLNLGDCNCGDGTNTFHCFDDISKEKNAPFGYGVNSIPLIPFVSVANNDKSRAVGTWLYAADFDGLKLPNGKVHNGCLQKVDSIGRGGTENHIDFFAMTEADYAKFDAKIKKDHIDVVWGSTKCDKKKLTGYGIKP